MTDTKKEHYVPRFYLKSFEADDERVRVFDKKTMSTRPQKILDVAMENYFYDIDFQKLLESVPPEKIGLLKKDLMEITETEKWEEVEALLNPKHIEKDFLNPLETSYAALFNKLICYSYDGNSWVIQNCKAFSDEEKINLSLYLAIQILRTKASRDSIKELTEKLSQRMLDVALKSDEGEHPNEKYEVSALPEYVKLEHSLLMLDDQEILHLAEVLCNHIWVMYVNKTQIPFYTSDNPVARIPHKREGELYRSGFASEGIEISFPITPNLLLGLYDEKTYGVLYSDRQYISIDSNDEVQYFNKAQILSSTRFVFSNNEDFSLAENICNEHPEIRDIKDRFVII